VEVVGAAPGCYRLHVDGTQEVEPVADLLVVAPR
jgi:hypothetical protein